MFWHSAGYSPRKSWRLPTRHDLLNIDNTLTKSITLPINVYGIVAYYLELLYYQGVEKLNKRKEGETKMTRADKETHTIEANRALDRRAKEILRQGSALMTYAEALAKARASAR